MNTLCIIQGKTWRQIIYWLHFFITIILLLKLSTSFWCILFLSQIGQIHTHSSFPAELLSCKRCYILIFFFFTRTKTNIVLECVQTFRIQSLHEEVDTKILYELNPCSSEAGNPNLSYHQKIINIIVSLMDREQCAVVMLNSTWTSIYRAGVKRIGPSSF